jgi:Cu/Ag efflux pump CusA
MSFFEGEGASLVQPIGKTVLGGLLISTLLTLFVTPAVYYIFNRLRLKKNDAKKNPAAEAAVGADI